VVEVASTSVSLTPTASPVIELRRRIEVEDGRLSYELHMAMEGIDLLSHVRSRLERV
jgi:THAP4-like, heme-binding beta-barrel domain